MYFCETKQQSYFWLKSKVCSVCLGLLLYLLYNFVHGRLTHGASPFPPVRLLLPPVSNGADAAGGWSCDTLSAVMLPACLPIAEQFCWMVLLKLLSVKLMLVQLAKFLGQDAGQHSSTHTSHEFQSVWLRICFAYSFDHPNTAMVK